MKTIYFVDKLYFMHLVVSFKCKANDLGNYKQNMTEQAFDLLHISSVSVMEWFVTVQKKKRLTNKNLIGK